MATKVSPSESREEILWIPSFSPKYKQKGRDKTYQDIYLQLISVPPRMSDPLGQRETRYKVFKNLHTREGGKQQPRNKSRDRQDNRCIRQAKLHRNYRKVHQTILEHPPKTSETFNHQKDPQEWIPRDAVDRTWLRIQKSQISKVLEYNL